MMLWKAYPRIQMLYFIQQIQQNMEGTQLISVRIIVQNILAVQRLHQ